MIFYPKFTPPFPLIQPAVIKDVNANNNSTLQNLSLKDDSKLINCIVNKSTRNERNISVNKMVIKLINLLEAIARNQKNIELIRILFLIKSKLIVTDLFKSTIRLHKPLSQNSIAFRKLSL